MLVNTIRAAEIIGVSTQTLLKYRKMKLIPNYETKDPGTNGTFYFDKQKLVDSIPKIEKYRKESAKKNKKKKTIKNKMPTEYIHPAGWNRANKAFNKAMRTT
jgi:DNA-binding transcriptional MerR regulator